MQAQVYPHGANPQMPRGSFVSVGGVPNPGGSSQPPNYLAQPMMMQPGMVAPVMQQPMYPTTGTMTPMGAIPVQQFQPIPIANPIAPMFYQYPDDHPTSQHMSKLASKLSYTKKLKVVQEITLLEACCGCEQQNIYNIYDETNGGIHILQANEKSDTCTRLCCNPAHSLMVEISDARDPEDVIVTMERPGLDCGICAKPCLPCFVCMPACGEEVTLHGGRVKGPAGNVEAPAPMAMMRQGSAFESPFNPKIEIKPAVQQVGGEDVTLSITGPTFFGGCSELCCRSSFPVTNSKGENAGQITKMPPRNFCSCLDEIATDSDTYIVDFSEGSCPEDKAAILASAILADYMFFEGDSGMCRRDPVRPSKIKCTLIECYCCGCVCPFNLELDNSGGGGGA
mmetsp:Transcript_19408/g.40513  ORF Transcript_19408/g.40513 Transcript_19408/m.40513 type:complete len:396 (-) Transcript_19408:285-1472(-)|eukprot:CAMPEP_0118644874 /NCGR_PEP_ID=MMETSP0785-20121206/7186_1 /TAXON_ID=91992 /ORGANISM="Bolidomonas pacifica, Strain CCMP 1866" /LENGTH=395 /DNA_ID=CAMNT_0006536691 /DNA_START=73 /DNA_END=1260 /DNA_ORIENTATION=+